MNRSLLDWLLWLQTVIIGLLLVPSQGLAASPGFGDAQWVGMGSLPGFDNWITSIVVDTNAGVTYVGGWFEIAGDFVANHVAKWDGTHWSGLGQGLQLNGTVYAMGLDTGGNLYVGGNFALAGGTPANGIAMWDGNKWSALGTNLSNGAGGVYVNALAFDSSGTLYIGGDFISSGATTLNHVARWNGNGWEALGSGVTGTNLTTINSMMFDHGGNLVVGGEFDHAGALPAGNVAKWDGTKWIALGSGLGGIYARVLALSFDSGANLYVGGEFSSAGGMAATNLARWDGTNWATGGLGFQDSCVAPAVYALAWSAGNGLYVSGTFTTAGQVLANNVARWDGTNWFPMGSGLGAQKCSPRIYPLTFDAGGNLLAAGTEYLARWDGSSWSAFPFPLSTPPGAGVEGEVTALATDVSNNLYAAGSFVRAGGVAATNIAKWNGTNWSALWTGLNYSAPGYRLAVDRVGNLYAGGDFTTAGGLPVVGLAKWSSNSWSAVGSGTNAPHGHVRALSVDSANNLYVGGWFDTGNPLGTNIARWDGSSWSRLQSGMNHGIISALTFDNLGNLYVGGAFTNVGNVSANNIARWNGTTWSTLGAGVIGEVSVIATDGNGNVYVGGNFANAGGLSITNLAKWDGTSWSSVGPAFIDYLGDSLSPFALAVDAAGTLYYASSGDPVTITGGILKWESGSWSSLGSGIRSQAGRGTVVEALAISGRGRLFAAGAFSYAGTNISYNVAQANILLGLENPARSKDGIYSFDVVTVPKSTNVILAASNLSTPVVWQPISTNLAPYNGYWHFVDTNAYLFLQRFYRFAVP